MSSRVLILDCGSQFTQLIARRVREARVFSEIHPPTRSLAWIREWKPTAIILSGGPSSVTDEGAPTFDPAILDLAPVLGVCYGMQWIAHTAGGTVRGGGRREYGRAELVVKESAGLFAGFDPGERSVVWMSHGDHVETVPPGYVLTASSEGNPVVAFRHASKPIHAVQFHAEVAHSVRGAEIIQNFLFGVAGCTADWTPGHFIEQEVAKIRERVGSAQVICGLSGGVDSSVAAALVHRAIGDQLTCIFVDTGLMRAGESEEVVNLFRDHYNIPLIHAEAKDLFLGRLAGVSDPEQKRKIIGAAFIDVFDRESAKVGGAEFLAQGTLYPDVIESVSATGGPSVTIKSHHNVGGLPDYMKLKLVEPLRELFKDEVRALGRELGLPPAFVGRHPFPGPGLAIRLPGEITEEKLEILRKADVIYLDEIRKAGLYDKIWQAFAVLLPVKTVGVMGDGRTYDHVCALRAVTSTDGMTADYYPFEHSFLARTATRIVNEVRGINRVVYDITSKPPGTIEWE